MGFNVSTVFQATSALPTTSRPDWTTTATRSSTMSRGSRSVARGVSRVGRLDRGLVGDWISVLMRNPGGAAGAYGSHRRRRRCITTFNFNRPDEKVSIRIIRAGVQPLESRRSRARSPVYKRRPSSASQLRPSHHAGWRSVHALIFELLIFVLFIALLTIC